MNVAIIGYGGRGMLYSEIFKNKNIEISALCDIDQNKLDMAKKKLGLSDEKLFNDDNSFFSNGKLADLLVVSTQDNLHIKHATIALDLGYDLLLEKPIATSINDCEYILKKAKENNAKVFVCHVLRYAPFFSIIKDELESGNYGKVSTINLTENVSYWHQAHSYVRGSWRKEQDSNPMIIAKCCHDLDLLVWFANQKCEYVSSFGSLNFFTEQNAPKDCALFCLDCKYKDSCSYSAEKIYIKDRAQKGLLDWPCNIVVQEPTVEKLLVALKTSPYGKCVFKCDNDVVDHQVVNMQFENGATAHLTMTAFSEDCYREIHVHCEKGEIFGNMRENKLYCNIFGKEKKVLDINILSDTSYGHGGGDLKMSEDIINTYKGKNSKSLTSIDNSMQSHFIGFKAEESRKNNGKSIKL